MSPRQKISAAALAVALFATACGGGDSTTETSAAAPEAAAPAEAADDANTDTEGASPSLVVPTVTGGQIDIGDLAGQDTVLWFWAPW